MVGLKQEHVGSADAIGDKPRAMAQISQYANAHVGCMQQETHRINGVMRHAEGVHSHIANLKGLAGFKQAKIKGRLVNSRDFLAGVAVAVNGDAQLGGKMLEAGHVVCVLVRDEDAIKPVGDTVNGGKALLDLARAKAAIHKEPCVARFQIGSIAR